MISYSFTLDNIEYFILILVRVSCFVYLAPLLGQQGIPNQTKIGLSFLLSIILYNVVDRPEFTYAGVMGYSVVVVKEGITGLLIGFAANICSSIVLFAGNIIDMDIGLSMATEFNQDMNSETTMTGNLYYYVVMLLLITSNLYTYLVKAIADSFSVIPIAGQVFSWDSIVVSLTRYMSDSFVIGFRIFLPIFACIMIANCVLGILARVAPQMNMFSVGMQIKILVGFLVLYLVSYLLPDVANYVYEEMKTLVKLIAQGLYE